MVLLYFCLQNSVNERHLWNQCTLRSVRLTHSDKLYVFHIALVRADQSKANLWESRDVEMI